MIPVKLDEYSLAESVMSRLKLRGVEVELSYEKKTAMDSSMSAVLMSRLRDTTIGR